MNSIFQADYTIVEDKLLCPSCFAETDISTILCCSTVSWPYQHWIYFQCPECGGNSHVEVHHQQIRTGLLDGAPGPCFFCCSQVQEPDFWVEEHSTMLVCTYKENRYIFHAKT
jgi:hypothetical protein